MYTMMLIIMCITVPMANCCLICSYAREPMGYGPIFKQSLSRDGMNSISKLILQPTMFPSRRAYEWGLMGDILRYLTLKEF